MYFPGVCRNLLFILSSFSRVKPEQVYLNLSLGCVCKTSSLSFFCVAAFGILPVVLCHLEMCFSKQVEVFVMLSRVKGLFCLFSNAVTFHGSFPALMLHNSWFLLQIFMADYLQPKLCFACNLIQLHLRLLYLSEFFSQDFLINCVCSFYNGMAT